MKNSKEERHRARDVVHFFYLVPQSYMKDSIKTYFVRSLPVMFGYLFLGTAFGILLEQAGYNYIWAFFISLIVFAGSMEFVLVSLLKDGASLGVVALMTLLINSRHIFYGLSFIERFKGMGKKYFYMIFSLTDETYSLLCQVENEPAENKDRAMFFIALFNHSYWIAGSVIGALVGQLIPIDFTGIDFSMTALFVVLFIEQWRSFPSHIPAYVGTASSAIFLLLLGPDNFILPSLIVTVAALITLKRFVKYEGEEIKKCR